jgi:hypothetical protein
VDEQAAQQEALEWMAQLAQAERDGERTTLVLGPLSAFTLIAALQLATRHPQLSPGQYAMICEFIDQVRPWFTGTPGEALIDAGADPAADVPREGASELAEQLGRRVREIWVAHAAGLPSVTPAKVAPWEQISDWDRQVDIAIGLELYAMGERAGYRAAGAAQA